MPERYRFLLRPWWIATHILLIVAVVTMVRLGFWQLDRLHEKQDVADALEFSAAQPAVPIDSLVDPNGGADAPEALHYRTVTATGAPAARYGAGGATARRTVVQPRRKTRSASRVSPPASVTSTRRR